MKNSDVFHIMTKPTSSLCNMDCTYCFYLEKEKLYKGTSDWGMSGSVLESFIRQYIETQKVSEISFSWQGGEPTLLGVDYFKNVIRLQNKYAEGRVIHNAFQTNGIELNEEWCDLFVENNFLIGLSIDGPEEIHDKYRVLKGGQPTFAKVMRGIEFLKKNKVEFNTLTCVQRDNSYKALEVYNFLKEIDSRFMQFIPIVERHADKVNQSDLNLVSPNFTGNASVTNWSVESLQYGKFLAEIFDEWIKKDVASYFVQMFDIALESWFGMEPSLCVFRETCGDAMALEFNGDLYSCDHYVYPENKLGNIMDDIIENLVNSGQQIKFGLDKKMTLPQYCKNCDYKFACNGECPKHRFITTPDGEAGLNYLCSGYKYFFGYIDPYMKFMANELRNKRPPANVMEWARKNQ